MEKPAIEFYFWTTPNGYKIAIFFEESTLPYRIVPVDILHGAQFAPEFLRISPNNKMPAIVDPDGPGGAPVSVFESGAILIYLAEKTHRFLPSDARARIETLEWLFFQVGGFGPSLGQAHHFRKFAQEKIPYAIERYTKEAQRLYGVLDARLTGREFIVDEYSIADMATYPWAAWHAWQGIDLADYPAVERWFNAVGARPAVQRAMAIKL